MGLGEVERQLEELVCVGLVVVMAMAAKAEVWLGWGGVGARGL